MPAEGGARVVYWDASALLSAFVEDVHSCDARAQIHQPGHNFVSTLAHAEVLAVLGRMERLLPSGTASLQRARTAYLEGPWRWVTVPPAADLVERFARVHPLRGADLWHLAVAATLRGTFPEMRLLTYDAALAAAAVAQGLAAPTSR